MTSVASATHIEWSLTLESLVTLARPQDGTRVKLKSLKIGPDLESDTKIANISADKER